VVVANIELLKYRSVLAAVPQWIEYRHAVLIYRYLSGTAPQHLAVICNMSLIGVVIIAVHSNDYSHITNIGDRSLPVTAANVWNNLPPSIRSLPSLLAF